MNRNGICQKVVTGTTVSVNNLKKRLLTYGIGMKEEKVADNPFRYVAEKLIEPAGEELWPLAILWFDPKTRGLKCSVANVGAELIVGHGRKIGLIIESSARELCKQPSTTARAATSRKESRDPQLPLPDADSAEESWSGPQDS